MATTGSFLVDTEDLGEAEEKLSENFGRINIGAVPDGAPTTLQVFRTGIGQLTLDEARWTYSMNFTMEPLDTIMLCRLHSGTVLEQRPDGDMVPTGPGQVLAYGATEGVPFAGAVHEAVYDLIVLDRRVLSAVAGRPKRGTHPITSKPVSHAANRMMVDAFDYVRHGVMANAHAGGDPLLAGALTNYLATAVVSAFPVDAAPIPRMPANTEVVVRRATAFIDDNAHLDITPADIAAAANLTPAVLQLMFVNHHGCSPMQYLRRVRLNHAHLELISADPAAVSVADIARRWGFPGVSRFAVSYRLAYGKSPGATLRADSRPTRH